MLLWFEENIPKLVIKNLHQKETFKKNHFKIDMICNIYRTLLESSVRTYAYYRS